MSSSECPVCLENLFDLCVVETPCQHRFCLSCFINWTKAECPLCRRAVPVPPPIARMFQKNAGATTTTTTDVGSQSRNVVPVAPGRRSLDVASVEEFPFLS